MTGDPTYAFAFRQEKSPGREQSRRKRAAAIKTERESSEVYPTQQRTAFDAALRFNGYRDRGVLVYCRSQNEHTEGDSVNLWTSLLWGKTENKDPRNAGLWRRSHYGVLDLNTPTMYSKVVHKRHDRGCRGCEFLRGKTPRETCPTDSTLRGNPLLSAKRQQSRTMHGWWPFQRSHYYCGQRNSRCTTAVSLRDIAGAQVTSESSGVAVVTSVFSGIVKRVLA